MSGHTSHKRFSLFPVLLTYFLDNFGLAIIYPIFTPIILLNSNPLIDTSATFLQRTVMLGVLIGAFPFAQFIGSPLLGQFSDRYGRKKGFFITILGTAIGYSFTAFSIMIHSVSLLFISRVLTGLFASNLTLCLAAIVDMSPDEHSRTKNFGHIAAIGGLSFILAIALGGFLSDRTFSQYFNPSIPFWITALMAFLNFYCMIKLFHETHPSKNNLTVHPFKGFHNIKLALVNNELKLLYIGNFFFMLSWVASMQFLPTFLIKNFSFSTANITGAFILVGVLWSLTNFFVNRQLVKFFHPSSTLNACLLLLGLLLLGLIFAQHTLGFLLLFYPAVSLASLCWTNSLANISLKASNQIQGSILGINQSMNSLASMLAPPIGGLIAGTTQHGMYIFTGLSSLIACYILWTANRRFPHHHPKRG